MTSRWILLALVLWSCVVAEGQAAEPWTLTADERITLRFESTRHPEPTAGPTTENTDLPPARFTIDGREHPELFLPGELMGMLLGDVDRRSAENGVARRSVHTSWLTYFGWEPEAFWWALRDSASGYLSLTAQETDSAEKAVQRKICSSRIAALNKMRRKYARFDEFLYRAIAPRHVTSTDSPASREWLLWLEGGCN